MSCGIYKITNQINGHSYVGQSISIEKRWRQHKKAASDFNDTSPIYLAMRKYGLENFSFEILEKCSQQELDDKERYWISHFDSYKNGYNATPGGQKGKFIYDVNKTRGLWDKGYTTGEISKILKLSHSTVRNHLLNYGNFSTHNSRSRSAIKNNHTKNLPTSSKTVYQYSLAGDFLKEYSSVVETEKFLGINSHSHIYSALNNNQGYAYGYQWSYIKTNKRDPIVLTKRLIKCVNTGEIFENVFQAMRWAHLKSKTGINYCCCGKQQTAGKHPVTGEKLKWEAIIVECEEE